MRLIRRPLYRADGTDSSSGTEGQGASVERRDGDVASASEANLLREALDRRRVRTLFQPLVDLATERVIGHEALSRGPVGSLLEHPGQLFAAARRVGRTAELDWACRCSAFRHALRSARLPSWRLFVNAEPEALDTACPVDLLPDWLQAHRSLRVVVELTERHLLARPAELLRVVGTLRELGWEVALDDVGANDDGVALLPVVEPDVVKLDAALLEDRLTRGQRSTLRAVEAWTHRSGTPVVAEGIETEAHLRRAVDLGATWGQGFRFGRPAPSVPGMTVEGARPRLARRGLVEEARGAGPYDVVPSPAATVEHEEVSDLLAEVCGVAAEHPASALLLVSVGDGTQLPADLLGQLWRLRDRCAMVALFAPDLPELPHLAPVRTTSLAAGDPMAGEVAAVLLGPRRALMVAARPRPDGRYDLVRSADPGLVARAARLLLIRARPQPESAPSDAVPVA